MKGNEVDMEDSSYASDEESNTLSPPPCYLLLDIKLFAESAKEAKKTRRRSVATN